MSLMRRGRMGTPTFQPDEASMGNLEKRLQNRRLGGMHEFPSDAWPERVGPSFQPDQGSMAAVADSRIGKANSFNQQIELLDNRNVPPQLKQVPYTVTLNAATDPPQLLLPENKNRMSFIVVFTDSGLGSPAVVLLTYGFPPLPGFGIPLVSLSTYGESNGTISIDEIWIAPFNNVFNGPTYPIQIVAYEGTLAIESFKNNSYRPPT